MKCHDRCIDLACDGLWNALPERQASGLLGSKRRESRSLHVPGPPRCATAVTTAPHEGCSYA